MSVNVSFPTTANAPVTQDFGNLRPDLYPDGDHRHHGIDYGVPVGTPVLACLDGAVAAVGVVSGFGRRVVLDHGGGVCSIYGHLSAVKVKSGMSVKAGAVIGLSGGDPDDGIDGDGTSTGAHLHWEIQCGGVPVDPEKYCLDLVSKSFQRATVQAAGGLRVRMKPGGQFLYFLNNGDKVEVVMVENGWARLRKLRPEWCSMDYLVFENPAPVPTPAELSDAEKLERLWKAHPELH